jgi:single-strand DNA-binding protein
MNSITLTGRLTRDPELRELTGGQSVCNLRLAVDGMSAGRETGYIDVAAFGKPGQAAAKVLTKGWLVSVDGRLDYRTWTQDDTTRHTYQVIGNVEFLAAPKHNGTDTPEPAESPAAL